MIQISLVKWCGNKRRHKLWRHWWRNVALWRYTRKFLKTIHELYWVKENKCKSRKIHPSIQEKLVWGLAGMTYATSKHHSCTFLWHGCTSRSTRSKKEVQPCNLLHRTTTTRPSSTRTSKQKVENFKTAFARAEWVILLLFITLACGGVHGVSSFSQSAAAVKSSSFRKRPTRRLA